MEDPHDTFQIRSDDEGDFYYDLPYHNNHHHHHQQQQHASSVPLAISTNNNNNSNHHSMTTTQNGGSGGSGTPKLTASPPSPITTTNSSTTQNMYSPTNSYHRLSALYAELQREYQSVQHENQTLKVRVEEYERILFGEQGGKHVPHHLSPPLIYPSSPYLNNYNANITTTTTNTNNNTTTTAQTSANNNSHQSSSLSSAPPPSLTLSSPHLAFLKNEMKRKLSSASSPTTVSSSSAIAFPSSNHANHHLNTSITANATTTATTNTAGGANTTTTTGTSSALAAASQTPPPGGKSNIDKLSKKLSHPYQRVKSLIAQTKNISLPMPQHEMAYNWSNRSIVRRFYYHHDIVNNVALVPSYGNSLLKKSPWIASCSMDSTICLFSTNNQQMSNYYYNGGLNSGMMPQQQEVYGNVVQRPEFVYRGHRGAVNTICFHPNTPLACSASGDGTVQLWKWDCPAAPSNNNNTNINSVNNGGSGGSNMIAQSSAVNSGVGLTTSNVNALGASISGGGKDSIAPSTHLGSVVGNGSVGVSGHNGLAGSTTLIHLDNVAKSISGDDGRKDHDNDQYNDDEPGITILTTPRSVLDQGRNNNENQPKQTHHHHYYSSMTFDLGTNFDEEEPRGANRNPMNEREDDERSDDIATQDLLSTSEYMTHLSQENDGIPSKSTPLLTLDHDNTVVIAAQYHQGRTNSEYSVVSGGWDRSLRLWDVTTGKLISRVTHHDSVHCSSSSSDNYYHPGNDRYDYDVQITDLQSANNNPWIITACNNGMCKIWDSVSHQFTHQFSHVKEHSVHMDTCAIFNSNDRMIITATQDGSCKIWDMRKLSEKHSLKSFSVHSGVNRLAISSYHSRFCVATNKRQVKIYDLSGKCVETLQKQGHDMMVNGVCWSEDGEDVFSCSADRSIIQWKVGYNEG